MSVEFYVNGRQCVFLHVPKTGGNWVEKVLSSLHLDRFSRMDGVMNRHNLFLEKLAGAFSFCFVRHPVKWYESYFRYQSGPGHWRRGFQFNPHGWHPWSSLDDCKCLDFSGFIEKCIRLQPAYVTRLYEWYTGPQGAERVSFIGRQENLASDLCDALSQSGLNIDPQKIYKATPEFVSPPILAEWNPINLEQIQQLERVAIKRFGYPTFELP
jgi:hypothetical protein